jgi:hypothetical protein
VSRCGGRAAVRAALVGDGGRAAAWQMLSPSGLLAY